MVSQLETTEGQIWYDVQGVGESVVLIHGNAASSRWWDPLIERHPTDFRWIRLDLPGFGRSDEPLTAYSIAGAGRAVQAVIEAVGGAPVWGIGHSLGGAVALELALAEPGFFRALLLIDPAPGDGMPLSPQARLALTEAVRQPAVIRQRLEAISPAADHGPSFDWVVAEALVARGWIPLAEALSRWNVMDRLGEIDWPVWVVQGEQDQLVPLDRVANTVRRLPQGHLEVLPGIGHCLPLEDPERLFHLIDRWVSTVSPNPPVERGENSVDDRKES
ncbi:MAG: alpha/beta hydrolase [Sulfobacillus sp.]|nr:alpha/beta hydrolase [Sulfobacillus sp.]